MYVGIVLLHNKKTHIVKTGMALLIPGVIAGSPGSLLNMPLLLNAMRFSLYSKVSPYI